MSAMPLNAKRATSLGIGLAGSRKALGLKAKGK
jgi:hypothetical protein